ncbi:hypothetical protein QQY66_32880 [Streptomyces sp. DG2A-72]|uniref:hypothetical protein n=1 Tax=Streptomyces sp. DG2A-72 TaxID=3051386 RepID=UPI00265C5CB6|nr:hypothetical protein [Streptomyces sp. DG2A-72]MDO0936265.1 hypothetical protein [Streptomyces sp. DG2A-72]
MSGGGERPGRRPVAARRRGVPEHLLSGDRRDFEQIVDEVLRSAPHRPELAAVGQRLNSAQLRTMALNASALITAAAATEYQDYVRVREEARRPVPSVLGRPAAADEAPESAGAGVVAVAAVLAPILAATAAAVLLIVGYVLKVLEPTSGVARTLLTTGWVFGAVTAVAILVAAVGLLITALRNGPSSAACPSGEPGDRVARAREAWREALMERGIVPFLREALAEPGAARAAHPRPTSEHGPE